MVIMSEYNSKPSITSNGENAVEVETGENILEEDKRIQPEEGKNEGAEQDGPPIDRGWAWVVLGGIICIISVNNFLLNAFFLSHIILFS